MIRGTKKRETNKINVAIKLDISVVILIRNIFLELVENCAVRWFSKMGSIFFGLYFVLQLYYFMGKFFILLDYYGLKVDV